MHVLSARKFVKSSTYFFLFCSFLFKIMPLALGLCLFLVVLLNRIFKSKICFVSSGRFSWIISLFLSSAFLLLFVSVGDSYKVSPFSECFVFYFMHYLFKNQYNIEIKRLCCRTRLPKLQFCLCCLCTCILDYVN